MSDTMILGARLLYPPLVERLVADGAVLCPADEGERRRLLDAHAAEVVVLVTSSAVGVDAALMDRLPKLEAIVNYGVGYDKIDVDAAKARGIVVTNTPDVLNDCVADLAVGLLIDVMRGIGEADRFTRAGRWGREVFPLRRRVTGAKVGVLGLGRIGLEVAARLEGFRCEIRYHNRSPRSDAPYQYVGDVMELAQWCDALVVATPGGAGTEALVNADVLTALGPRGYLVNIARGSVVDEGALVDGLVSGSLAGAGLDVFTREPRVPELLLDLDNVVLNPHIASATEETRQAMADLVFANVRGWLDDRRPVTAVTS